MNDKIKKYREEITARVIEALKNGTAPWQRPWTGDSFPINAVTGRRYNGMNQIILLLTGLELDKGTDPRWATFVQAKQKGWKIRKGAEGTIISFSRIRLVPILDEQGNPVYDEEGKQKFKTVSTFRYFTVFHASQIDGIPTYEPLALNKVEVNEKAERVMKDSGADIRYGGYSAFYHKSMDYIQLPHRESFTNSDGFYSTVLHELSHWTGHSSRLNRDLSGKFGSDSYAREELTAELASMFLSGEIGIPQDEQHIQDHAAYLDSWVHLLSSDSNALFKAASEANKVSEFLLKNEHEREMKGSGDSGKNHDI